MKKQVLSNIMKRVAAASGVASQEGREYTDFTGRIAYAGTDGEVEEASFSLREGKVIWHSGTWTGGFWQNGLWESGVWMDGTWRTGVWPKGVPHWTSTFRSHCMCQIFHCPSSRMKSAAAQPKSQ